MEEKKLLLIAEDDRSNFRYLQVILRKEFDILWAHDGAEAVEMALNNDVVLILMDNRMPVANGIQAMIEIKKVKPDIPIIMQSAFAFDSDVEDAMKAGADGYLTKPIMREQLNRLIEEIKARMLH